MAGALVRVDHVCFTVLGLVHQSRAHGDVLVPGDNLDAHKARNDGLREFHHNLLIAVSVTRKDTAVGDVGVLAVELVARAHLERVHHLVAASTRLDDDALDGRHLAGVDSHPFARTVVLRGPSLLGVEHAASVTGSLGLVAVNGGVVARDLSNVGDRQRLPVLGGNSLLGTRHSKDAGAHGDASMPLHSFDLYITRRHNLGEERLCVHIVARRVEEYLAAVDVLERSALFVRNENLEFSRLLSAVRSALCHDAGNVHGRASVHGVCFASGVSPGEPAVLTVKHAGVVAVARLVVGVAA